MLVYTTQVNNQPQIVTLFLSADGNHLRETKQEATLFCS